MFFFIIADFRRFENKNNALQPFFSIFGRYCLTEQLVASGWSVSFLQAVLLGFELFYIFCGFCAGNSV